MKKKISSALSVILLVLFLLNPWFSQEPVQAKDYAIPHQQVSAYDLISAMNVLRMSYGLPGLIMDGTINAVAQSTAQQMADENLSWHIGNVSGRVQAAGYGAGKRVFATENFAMASSGATIDQIMVMWNDEAHMLPATNPHYCHVGAGVATAANGFVYYILQAAYISGEACTGATTPPGGTGPGTSPGGGQPIIPGIITPVELVEPNEKGIYTHLVMPGQSFWAIAVAYQVTIKEILSWNHLTEAYKLQIGDELTILGPDAEGYVPPPKMGAVEVSAPRVDGSVFHTVKAYENLSKIAEAYEVSVKQILELNGIQETTPLGIGWELMIVSSNHTSTPTERPLTPIEMLTPAADGKYYHTVVEGQNLNWIADYYGVALGDLLTWNNLKETSIIYAGNKLLLNVTPPATITPTFTPITPTATATITPTATPSPTPMPLITQSPLQESEAPEEVEKASMLWLPVGAGLALLLAGGLMVFYQKRVKQAKPKEE